MNTEMERQAFEAHMRLGGYSNPEKHQDGSYVSSAMELWWQGWKARATRPAQTEQQPVEQWQVRYLLGQKVEERWWQDSTALAKGLPGVWEIRKFYAAPIAQTALSAVTAERDRLRKDRDDCVEARVHYAGKLGEVMAERDQLRAELEMLRDNNRKAAISDAAMAEKEA